MRSLAHSEECDDYGVKIRPSQKLSKTNQRLWDGYEHNKPAKKSRKKYNKRGKKHEIEITGENYSCLSDWRLQEQLVEQGIPYRIEKLMHVEIKERKKYERVITGQVYRIVDTSKTRDPITNELVRQNVYKLVDNYEWVVVGTEKYKSRRQYGVRVVWWSDKDIGIKYILSRSCKPSYMIS
jgi:hypothetical protein